MLDPSLRPTRCGPLLRPDAAPVEWAVSEGYVDYPDAVAAMEARVAKIQDGGARELVWLLEHPPIYTAGVSAKSDDLISARFPVHRTDRGGQFTYHGPGQRVAYVMLDLRQRGRDARRFVGALEQWVIDGLDAFGLKGETRPGRVGVWIERKTPGVPPREDKIAALGVKLRRWVSFHGISLNVEPDLTHFDEIVPCGIRDHGVTSLVDLGRTVTMEDADVALRRSFTPLFGEVIDAAPPL